MIVDGLPMRYMPQMGRYIIALKPCSVAEVVTMQTDNMVKSAEMVAAADRDAWHRPVLQVMSAEDTAANTNVVNDGSGQS